MAIDKLRRQELADFLKKHREKLVPADFGISEKKRRRTSGLRREEVADLAGISSTWYTWFEQGRNIQVSISVLESLSQVLHLNRIEREHLFMMAGKTIPSESYQHEIVSEGLRTMIANLEFNPAYIIGKRWDILAWNRLACAVLGDFDSMSFEERNTVWRVFTNPEVKQQIINWEQIAQHILAQFRLSCDRYAGEASFVELIERLKVASPEFRSWWSRHDVMAKSESYKEIDHPQVGRMAFQHATFLIPDIRDLKFILYTPLSQFNTKEKMLQLLIES